MFISVNLALMSSLMDSVSAWSSANHNLSKLHSGWPDPLTKDNVKESPWSPGGGGG